MGRVLMITNLHSMEFEQYVLCFLMDDDNSFNWLEVKPNVDDFYATRHKEIFKIIENQNILGKSYNFEVVVDLLKSMGTLESVGGEQYFLDMMSHFAAPSAVGSFIEKLKKLTECRKVEEAGRKIMELAQNTLIDDMPRIVHEIASGVESVLATDTRVDLKTSAVEALEVLRIKQEHKSKGDGLAYGVNTGLKNLDDLLGDIEPTHFCVIAAAPGGGKTTMAQMIALNAVKRNKKSCLFFSCEMAHYEVTNRILSAQGRIPYNNIQTGKMSQEDYTTWVHLTANVFPDYKLDIVDKAGITIQEIRGEVNKSIAKYGEIGCIIVDYIQLLQDHKAKDQFEKVSNISMALKKIAKDFKVPVIALSQLTKEAIGRKITMSDLRGSGQIAQDADKIILLSPDAKGVGVICAEVAKNRQGAKGEARLVSAFDYCQFKPVAVKEDH